jgi:hypothetical protein
MNRSAINGKAMIAAAQAEEADFFPATDIAFSRRPQKQLAAALVVGSSCAGVSLPFLPVIFLSAHLDKEDG